MADQAALARTTALLRGTAQLVPRGVYRFSSFEEADAWMTQMMLRTHAHPSRKTTKDIDLLGRRADDPCVFCVEGVLYFDNAFLSPGPSHVHFPVSPH